MTTKALHQAIIRGHGEVVEYLVTKANVDIHQVWSDGRSILVIAAICKQKQIVDIILPSFQESKHPMIRSQTLQIISGNYDGSWVDVAKKLIEAGVDVNYCEWCSALPPLSIAGIHGNVDMVKLLLNQKDVDINKVASGETALMSAWRKEKFEVLHLLLDAGAKDLPICEGSTKRTLLMSRRRRENLVVNRFSQQTHLCCF